MFFPFTSSKLYPKRIWPVVWEFEKTAYSVLVDNIPKARRMSEDKFEMWFRSEFQQIVEELDFDKTIRERFDTLLRKEIPAMFKFLRGLTYSGNIKTAAALRLLRPDQTTLKKRLSESEVFRKYIANKGRP